MESFWAYIAYKIHTEASAISLKAYGKGINFIWKLHTVDPIVSILNLSLFLPKPKFHNI